MTVFSRTALLGLSVGLVASCAHSAAAPSPVLTPIEVAVPIATGCVPANMADAPEYPDTDAALKGAADAAERYLLLYAGRKVRITRLAEIETVVSGCQKTTALKTTAQ